MEISIWLRVSQSNHYVSNLDTFALSSFNINPTCFENSKNPNCLNLLLTNFKLCFKETGISDHLKTTIMKLHFTRESSKTKYYRDYLKFDIDYFSSELSRQIDSIFSSIKQNKDCEIFKICLIYRHLLKRKF